ncbi:MAG: hypothetical protein K6G18_16445 [Treponema sp.]|nr:hypothetical protein [Treponema sp.]
MKKTKILSVLLASLACVALLGSCDYWKEDYYKNGGDSGSVASGGSGGTGTLVVQASSGSTGGSSSETHVMTAEEKAIHNSLLGTRWRSSSYVPVADRASSSWTEFSYDELIINADGSGEAKYVVEDRDGNILRVEKNEFPNMPGFHGSYVTFDADDPYVKWWFEKNYCTDDDDNAFAGVGLNDDDGDGVFNINAMVKLN